MWFLSRFVHILQFTLTRSSRFRIGFLILHLLHTSHYNICSPASLRLRLPIHILSIVPFTSFSGSNIYPLPGTRPSGYSPMSSSPSLRCGAVLVPSVFDNPHLYRLFHDCLRRIALRAAYSYIRFLHRKHRHAASIPHARYTQSEVQHLRRITIHLHNHTANTSMRGV